MNGRPVNKKEKGPKIIRFFYASLAIHLAALIAVVFASFHNPRRNFNFNVMQVQLYSAATIAAQSAQDLAASKAVAAVPEKKPAGAPKQAKKDKAILPKDALKEDISKGAGGAQAVSDAGPQARGERHFRACQRGGRQRATGG